MSSDTSRVLRDVNRAYQARQRRHYVPLYPSVPQARSPHVIPAMLALTCVGTIAGGIWWAVKAAAR